MAGRGRKDRQRRRRRKEEILMDSTAVRHRFNRRRE